MQISRKNAEIANENNINIVQCRVVLSLFQQININKAVIIPGTAYQFFHVLHGLHFQIAINYGGRDEIIRAVKKLSAKVQSGEVSPETITADMLEDYLDTAGIPDPDLLIRTCNEQRISNFLLWQLAYTEFYFTPVPWPDFTKEELMKAVEAYNHRDRRYGGLKEE